MIQLSKYISESSGFILRNLSNRVVKSSSAAYTTINQSGADNTKPESDDKELDDLYKRVVVQVRGHDPAVLESYQTFVKLTGQYLDCPPKITRMTPKHSRFIERWTLLKSRFGNRKHMRQYEMRTYFKEFTFQHLTGSTSDTLLEYIQRNLPEGVAMHVHKTRIGQLPEHFKNSS